RIAFAPLAPGTRVGQLTISGNAAAAAHVDLSGLGTPPGSQPTVTILATDSAASEDGSDTGTFTITRTGATTTNLSVSLTAGGTATNGTDYATIDPVAVIPAGQSSVAVIVTPFPDTLA